MALAVANAQQVADSLLAEQHIEHGVSPTLVVAQGRPRAGPIEKAQGVDELMKPTRAVGSRNAVVHRLRPVLGEAEMLRQPIEPVVEPAGVELLERMADARVEVGALMLEKSR